MSDGVMDDGDDAELFAAAANLVEDESGFGDLTEEDPTPSGPISGLMGRAKSMVSEGKARLGFADGTVSNIEDAQLRSVVAESEPGTALELMRKNIPFAYDGGRASLIIVLPTGGEFGGLSKRSRNDKRAEEKGSIINDLDSDAINAVVTEELLDENALGLIPNVATLARMEEYRMLREARYRWAIACDDVETGRLRIFAVPSTTMSGAVDGPSFEQIQEIARNKASAGQFVDPDVVGAMLEVYRSATAAESGGVIEDVVRRVMDLQAAKMRDGGYPSSDELIAVITDETAPAETGRHRADTPVVESESDGGAVDEDGMGFDEVIAAPVVESEPDGFDESEPSFVDDTPAVTPSAPSRSRAAAAAPVDTTSIANAVADQLEKFREEFSELVSSASLLPSGAALSQRPSPEPVEVEPGAEFTHDQVLSSAGQRYLNTELELYVDPLIYRERFASQVPRIDMPEVTGTPWLTEQVASLVSGFNAELAANYEATTSDFYNSFLHSADLAAAETSKMFDPRKDPNSSWGKSYATLTQERRMLGQTHAKDVAEAESRVARKWQDREDQFVADAVARAKMEFNHRQGPRRDAEIKEAGARVLAAGEAISDRDLADFNADRKAAAQDYFDIVLADILDVHRTKFTELLQDRHRLVAAMSDQLRNFIDEHRGEDLRQAEVLDKQLAADTRYEQALADGREQLRLAQEQADARIAAVVADADRRRDEHNKQLEIASQTNAMQLNSKEASMEALKKALVEQQEQSARDLEYASRSAEQRVNFANAAVADAERARDEAEHAKAVAESRANTVNWVILAVMLILVAAAFGGGYVISSL